MDEDHQLSGDLVPDPGALLMDTVDKMLKAPRSYPYSGASSDEVKAFTALRL